MTTSPHNSKMELLKRYLNIFGGEAIEPPDEVSPRLKAWCELFIAGKLNEMEQVEFEQELAANPWLLTYLERWPQVTADDLLAKSEIVLLRGEALRQSCLATLPRAKDDFDFTVLFNTELEKMNILLQRGGTVVDQLESAHGDQEQTSITHSRATRNFNFLITVSYSGDGLFDMSMVVQSLDLTVDLERCRVRITSLDGSTAFHSQVFTLSERKVELVDLAKGAYKIEILHRDMELDYLTMNLTDETRG